MQKMCQNLYKNTLYGKLSPDAAVEKQGEIDNYNAPYMFLDPPINMFDMEINVLYNKLLVYARTESISGRQMIDVQIINGGALRVVGYPDDQLTLLPSILIQQVFLHLQQRFLQDKFIVSFVNNGACLRIKWVKSSE